MQQLYRPARRGQGQNADKLVQRVVRASRIEVTYGEQTRPIRRAVSTWAEGGGDAKPEGDECSAGVIADANTAASSPDAYYAGRG
jgi:hypothetical protein